MPLETPAQAMKRIEAEIRSPPVMPFAGASIGPGQTYSGTGGLRAGPLSAMGIVAGDSSGAPQVYGGRAALNAGPVEVSYRHMQPSAPVAPVQSLGVTARPFDPDMYFGAEATQGPGGRSYGLSAGKGNFNATAGYSPQNRGMNVGFEFKRNFAEGGPTEEARPLTIFAKGPKAAPEGEVDVAGPLTQMAEPKPDPYAGVPAPEAYSRRFADTLAGIPQSVIDYFTAKQAAPAPAQNAGEDLGFIGSSIAGLPGAAAGYFQKKAEGPDPSQRIAEDIMNLGGGLKQMFMENPMGMAMDIMNLPGAVTSLHDASEAKQKYNEAVASGDMDKAAAFKNQFGLAMAGVLPVVGGVMKTGAKASKLGEEAARAGEAVKRELSPIGLYSHGAETAAGLQQAKGTPDQMIASLRRSGVKPDELFQSGIADEAATLAKRSMIESQYAPQIAQAEEGIKALRPEYDDVNQILNDPAFKEAAKNKKTPEGQAKLLYDKALNSMRSDMDSAMVLSKDWASRSSVTRDEIAQHFSQSMPQVEERVLGSLSKMSDADFEKNYDSIRDRYVENTGREPRTDAVLRDWAEERQITRENEPRHQQHTLPGGENYREVLLKLPQTDATGDQMAMKLFGAPMKEITQPQRAEVINALTTADPRFKSQHWDDPNVLAHLRMSDRTGPNGEKILHVEEVQSDWGQAGRKQGFKDQNEKKFSDLVAKRDAFEVGTPEYQAANQAVIDFAVNVGPDVPTGPYVTSTQGWTDLALKRALKEAAEGGYDKLVWTPGAEQAKRYNLSSVVDRIAYDPIDHELSYVQKGGSGWTEHPGFVKPEDLPGIIGEEAAQKLLSTEPNPLSGSHNLEAPDLSFGGEGMKSYYDKMLPKRLQELVKKHGKEAKLGRDVIPVNKEGWTLLPPEETTHGQWGLRSGYNIPHERFGSEAEARLAFAKKLAQDGIEAQSLTITPQMRESILRGQHAYADGGPVQGAPAQSNIEQGVGETTADITKLAQEGDLDRRKIAYLIRQASTGTIAPDKAFEFAGEILSNDVQALLERFQRYPRAMRILARVDLALGGLGGQSLGTAANQRVRTRPVSTDNRAGEEYAKGGSVRKPYQGDKAAFEQFSDFALETYGPQIGKNMINRADGNAAKLLFALNQYEKNVQSQDPSPATMQAYKAHLAQLTGIAKQFKIDPRAAFNRTTDALDTRKELDGILKSDHKMNPAFKAALDRMSRLVGSR